MPEPIDYNVAIPLIIILWTLLIIITLVSLRRAKVKRDQKRRIIQQIQRRERYIDIMNARDEELTESLERKSQR